MKAPVDLVAAVSDGQDLAGTSTSDATNACEREQEIPFDFYRGAEVDVGDAVTLRAGDPVTVFSGAQKVGVLAGSAGRAMQSCIDFGYRMTGVIASLEGRQGAGVITISGEPS